MPISYRNYKYRIYPTEEQKQKIDNHLNKTAALFDLALADMIKAYEHNNAINKPQLKDYLPLLNIDINDIDNVALTYTLNALYRDFQKSVAEKKPHPPFKRNRKRLSYCTNAKYNRIPIINGRLVSIPSIGDVEIVLHRDMPNDPLNATIIRHATGDYYIDFLFAIKILEQKYTVATEKNSLGLDYHNNKLYIDNNGKSPNYPHFYAQNEEKLKQELDKLHRKKKGSKNYEKQRIKVAKLYEKIQNQRNDWQHKITKELAAQYEYIGVEDLDLAGIISDERYSSNAMDNAFYQFCTKLRYKLESKGACLFKINRYIRSSQTCHKCGYINRGLKTTDRDWVCPECGMHHNRDINAAKNILQQVLKFRGKDKWKYIKKKNTEPRR